MAILGLSINDIFVCKYDHPYYKRLLGLCIKGMQCEYPLGWRRAAVAFQSVGFVWYKKTRLWRADMAL